jgi:hypothetical protein
MLGDHFCLHTANTALAALFLGTWGLWYAQQLLPIDYYSKLCYTRVLLLLLVGSSGRI